MLSYSTPEPIDLAIDLQVGRILVQASKRDHTSVTVSPGNPAKPADKRGAEATTVDFDGQVLTIVGPKPRIPWLGPSESVDVLVTVPSGSRLTVEIASGPVRATGPLGSTRIRSISGPIDLEATGDLSVHATHGNTVVGRISGSAKVTATHGQVRIDTVRRDASLNASHGSITLGETIGNIEARLSYGDLDIMSATAAVTAKTAYGSIYLHKVASDTIDVDTGFGQITIGVSSGTATWLDLLSREGQVHNELSDDTPAADTEAAALIRARTRYGDIVVQRSR